QLLFTSSGWWPGAESSDARFDDMTLNGFEPFFRLGTEGSSNAATFTRHGPKGAVEQANWITAAKCTLDHYHAKSPFAHAAILTEYSPNFWDDPSSSYSFNQFEVFWANALHELQDWRATTGANVKLGGPGFMGQDLGDLKNLNLADPTCNLSAVRIVSFLDYL